MACLVSTVVGEGLLGHISTCTCFQSIEDACCPISCSMNPQAIPKYVQDRFGDQLQAMWAIGIQNGIQFNFPCTNSNCMVSKRPLKVPPFVTCLSNINQSTYVSSHEGSMNPI
jgi:hypothetical protein